ncbi:hypothetical protein MN202_04775 [Rheinheimera muenzenbergensis]|jgi:hypothetical protein|uniref:Uncharacterized protein n=2 Tax=Rheinheimera TaxID=67575 RepID=A0ABU8C3T8_9GAMM|nr:hypothetical protein [Rheinheimera maricola]MBZ9612697.1 hypothetical protein [Rheinheimera maricola]
MNSVTKTLISQLEVAQLVIDKEFNLSEEAYGATQLDLFAEQITEIRIQRIGAKLMKMTKDENFVSGVVAMLNHVYLPDEYYTAEEIAGLG